MEINLSISDCNIAEFSPKVAIFNKGLFLRVKIFQTFYFCFLFMKALTKFL